MVTRLSLAPILIGSLLLAILSGCATVVQETPTPEVFSTTLPPSETTTPPTAPPATLQTDSIAEVDKLFTTLSEHGSFFGAVLVAHNGEVVLSKGYGLADREQEIPITSQSRFRIASLTKQFTAMAILILQAQGQLEVTDLICEFLTDCPPAWAEITIHHLLTHTAGIPDFLENPDYVNMQATHSPSEQSFAHFKELPLDFQPGEDWFYSNFGYILLGFIIEHVSGQSYEAFLQQTIFTPLEMHDTGYEHHPDDVVTGYLNLYTKKPVDFVDMSIVYSAGALYSTVEDLYLWDQALYAEELLPLDQLDLMITPHAKIPDGTILGKNDLAYGYGWAIGEDFGRKSVWHTGGTAGFSSIITRFPEDQVTIIVLCNLEETDVIYWSRTIAEQIFGDRE